MYLLVAREMCTGFPSACFELGHLPRQDREDVSFLLYAMYQRSSRLSRYWTYD